MKLGIYIPSRSRPEEQITLKNIPSKFGPILVVPTTEAKEYRQKNPNTFVLSCPANGIAATRQWIMENASHKYVLFMDDDMSFHCRKEGKLTSCLSMNFTEMVMLLYSWLDKEHFVHVGVSQRAGNNRIVESSIDITRMNNVYAYNREEFLRLGVRFDRLAVMEDFDVTLTLLELGFPNRVTYDYAWSQGKSGAPGGCSIYRTLKVQQDAVKTLARLHGNVVKIVNKTAATHWENIGYSRCDVVISWKDAYHPTKRALHGIDSFLQK